MRRLLFVATAVSGLGVAPLLAQTPRLTLVPSSATINAGQQVEVKVFIENLPRAMRAFQAEVRISGGNTGRLELLDADNDGQADNNSIFVDQSHASPPWFFVDWPSVDSFAPLIATRTDRLRVGTVLFSVVGLGPFPGARYLGTYVFEASGDASGTFQIGFFGVETSATVGSSSTFLRGSNSVLDPILPFDAVGTSIGIIAGPAPNSECTGALTIDDGVTPFDLRDVDTVGGPAVPANCNQKGTQIGQDIWYKYTASCTGPVTISTCNDADFDSRLLVYGGTSTSCTCPSSSTVAACSDDAPGCGQTSEVVFNAAEGFCYTVRVASFDTLGPQVSVGGNISVVCIGNDTCATAVPVTANGGPVAGSTTNTNSDSGLPACGGFGTSTESGGVWYSVTGSNALMTASLGQGSFDSRLSVFRGSCGSLTCVGAADNPGGGGESVSWCGTAGTQYFILVHGATGQEGSFQLSVGTNSCNDGNACTSDSCSAGACVHTDSTPPTHCCNPANGNLTVIDDQNPCTTDTCNTSTGAVAHTPVPDGLSSACNDDENCTIDECISGNCVNTDINTLSCNSAADCVNPQSPLGDNQCIGPSGNKKCSCVEAVAVQLDFQPGSLPVPGCYDNGELIEVRIEMGVAADPIVAAQVFLQYDTANLQFISVAPGDSVDASSPFEFELGRVVDQANGTIDYFVGDFSFIGSSGPTTLAVVVFQALNEGTTFVQFRDSEQGALLIAADSTEFPADPVDPIPLRIAGPAPSLSACPADIVTGFDDLAITGTVSYSKPTAIDSSEGPLPVSCVPPSGSAFPSGITVVRCTATNSCGKQSSCTFDVEVLPTTVTMDVRLAPLMASNTIDRCIEFKLHDCATGSSVTIPSMVSFTNGLASGATIQVHGGNWDCVTARDPLHTLRRTSNGVGTSNFRDYSTAFVNDPAFGGDWLIGGNLNGDGFIDIRDFVIFMRHILTTVDPDTPCGTSIEEHADVDGNGLVDVRDLSFIQSAIPGTNELGCCGGAGFSGGDEPREAMSLVELRRLGMGYLQEYDLNKDGMISMEDLNGLLANPQLLEPAFKANRERGTRPGFTNGSSAVRRADK